MPAPMAHPKPPRSGSSPRLDGMVSKVDEKTLCTESARIVLGHAQETGAQTRGLITDRPGWPCAIGGKERAGETRIPKGDGGQPASERAKHDSNACTNPRLNGKTKPADTDTPQHRGDRGARKSEPSGSEAKRGILLNSVPTTPEMAQRLGLGTSSSPPRPRRPRRLPAPRPASRTNT